jgi:hypothetical protein
MNKYHAKRTKVDGILFHSQKEARRYSELLLLERGGIIRNLRRQVRYPLVVNDVEVTVYIADFVYESHEHRENGDVYWKMVHEDVKGWKGRGAAWEMFTVKRKLMLALYAIDVLIT